MPESSPRAKCLGCHFVPSRPLRGWTDGDSLIRTFTSLGSTSTATIATQDQKTHVGQNALPGLNDDIAKPFRIGLADARCFQRAACRRGFASSPRHRPRDGIFGSRRHSRTLRSGKRTAMQPFQKAQQRWLRAVLGLCHRRRLSRTSALPGSSPAANLGRCAVRRSRHICD